MAKLITSYSYHKPICLFYYYNDTVTNISNNVKCGNYFTIKQEVLRRTYHTYFPSNAHIYMVRVVGTPN